MLRVLAWGMGWKEVPSGRCLPVKDVTTFAVGRAHGREGLLICRPKCGMGVVEEWNPLVDGRAAFELLVAMRGKPPELFHRFEHLFWLRFLGKHLLRELSPALIAQAAFEALEASHE